MSDRLYRLMLGALLLVALYFELPYLMYFIIAMLFFEGLSNLRLPVLLNRLRGRTQSECDLAPFRSTVRLGFEAERAWRLIVALMLLVTYAFFYDRLWFFPWFMGFAIFGAGVSGVCPVLIGVKWAGCR